MQKSSSLTRAVFRALIASRPYVPAECLRRPLLHSSPRPWKQHGKPLNHHQRRTLFNIFGGETTPRILEGSIATPKNLEVAIGKLVDLLKAKRSHARAPQHEQLVDAIRFLFSARLENKTALTRNEVFLATETFKYLQGRDLVLGGHAGALQLDDLNTILSALTLQHPKERFRSDIRALAELIQDSLRNAAIADSRHTQRAYLTILARTGSAIEARDILSKIDELDSQAWIEVAKGLLEEARGPEIWELLDAYDTKFGDLDPSYHEELVAAFLKADRIWDAQRMFDIPVNTSDGPTSKCISRMLQSSVTSGQLNTAEGYARQLSLRPRDQHVVGALILFHAARDSNMDDLRHFVHGLLQSSSARITMSTFNDVIEHALKHNKVSLAIAVQELAESENFAPDGKTYVLRLQHAVDMEYWSEAENMYRALLAEDVPSDDFDIPILNRYVAKLSFAHNSLENYELIMRVTDTLLERGADLEAETIAGLCHVFLRRGEIDEATSLLRYRADFYSLPERAQISTVFRDFVVDLSNSPQRAFNAYDLFRYAFPETAAHLRLPLMQSFFDRKRPDLACQVFAHMRQADPGEPARPNAAAYAKCFEGIAQTRDVDGLQSIHNMLKLDLQVDLTTQIRNGIMLACIACQMPWQAIIDHFYKIMDSREGPSYSTFEVALRACETWPPYGSFEARKIIAVMQSWNLEITKSLYDNYVGVMAGQCEFENAVELIENMENDIGEAPDAFTIGTFYNAIPWQFRKDEVEKWAKVAYPELWERLVSLGEIIDGEWEVRYFNIDRSIDINDEPLFAEGEWKPELQRQMQADIEPLPMAT